jgi:hypothetical protein
MRAVLSGTFLTASPIDALGDPDIGGDAEHVIDLSERLERLGRLYI